MTRRLKREKTKVVKATKRRRKLWYERRFRPKTAVIYHKVRPDGSSETLYVAGTRVVIDWRRA